MGADSPNPVSANPTPRPHQCERCGQLHHRCLGHNRRGGPCGQQPLNGSDVCRTHGARSPQALAKAQERVAEQAIRSEVTRLGLSIEGDPADQLLARVWEAAGNVEYYRSRIQALQDAGEEIYAPMISAAGKDGDLYETGEAKPHVLVVLYNQERDRHVDYCATAMKLGIEQRRLRLQESHARALFAAVAKAVNAAQLTEEQGEVFRRELAAAIRSEPARLAS